MVPPVFVGMGSNLGDRMAALRASCALLAERGLGVRATSSLYLTEPVGGPPQDWFLNGVLEARTDLSPEAALDVLLSVEAALGRVRSVRHGPRTLDLDLLLFGDEVRESPTLQVPHPRLPDRRFVLVPLAELAPEQRHPVSGLSVRELLLRCPDRSRVERHAPPLLP